MKKVSEMSDEELYNLLDGDIPEVLVGMKRIEKKIQEQDGKIELAKDVLEMTIKQSLRS